MWQPYKKGFKAYLQLERSLSENSVDAYLHDVELLTQWMLLQGLQKNPAAVVQEDLQQFLKAIAEMGMGANSQARIMLEAGILY